mmetsp:Transcript_66946/g.160327  ORF Transcript_66946/g.160327 Transcript_66946/m.160327 type:complete len:832 (+) Transcript_66946:58-2553(+)
MEALEREAVEPAECRTPPRQTPSTSQMADTPHREREMVSSSSTRIPSQHSDASDASEEKSDVASEGCEPDSPASPVTAPASQTHASGQGESARISEEDGPNPEDQCVVGDDIACLDRATDEERQAEEKARKDAIVAARVAQRDQAFRADKAAGELAALVMAEPLDTQLKRLHPGLRLSVVSAFVHVLEEAWPFVKEDVSPEAYRSIQALGREGLEEVCNAVGVPIEAVPPGCLPEVQESLGEIMWPSKTPEEMALGRDLLVRILFAMHEAKASNGKSAEIHVLFNARFRHLVHQWLIRLGVNPSLLLHWEKVIGSHAFRSIRAAKAESDAERRAKRKNRRVKVAVAAVLGGAALAITGGLAAPAVGAGFGILGGAIGTTSVVGGVLASTGTVVASLGSGAALAIFGAGGAGLAGWKYSRVSGALKEFSFIPLNNRVYGDEAELFRPGVPAPRSQSAGSLGSRPHAHFKRALKHSASWLSSRTVSGSDGGGASAEHADRPLLGRSATTALCDGKSSEKDVSAAGFSGPEDAEEGTQVDLEADSVQVVICVNGWMSEDGEVEEPFLAVPKAIFPCSDVYALAWDTKHLRQLGMFLYRFGATYAADVAARYWIQATIAAASASAAATVALPMYVVSNMARIDNAWYIVKDRTNQAAVCLASAISDKVAIGSRPVTLVGFSMGARVVFKALLELHRRGAYHVVADVVLMGAPVSTTWTSTFGQDNLFTTRKKQWEKARSVVSGRFVNCYSWQDFTLGALYRYMEMGICVAGLGEVDVAGVENLDVSDLVHSHEEYADRVEDVLRKAGFDPSDKHAASLASLEGSALPAAAKGAQS